MKESRTISAPLMIAWRNSWIYSSPSTRVNGRWAFAFSSVFTAHHKGIGTLLSAPPRPRRLCCYDAVSQIHFGSLDTVRCFEYTNYPASGLIHILTDYSTCESTTRSISRSSCPTSSSIRATEAHSSLDLLVYGAFQVSCVDFPRELLVKRRLL